MRGAESDIQVMRDLPVPVRDGVVLRCDVYRPAGTGPFPVLVQRTPYDKAVYDAVGRKYAESGYLIVIQDVRGQFASEGTFEPWVNEAADGYDTIEWAASLAGGSGRVGTIGTSYQAAAQWQAAMTQPPHLTAMVTAVTPADYYDQWVFPGAFALSFNSTWLLNNVAQSAARRLPDGEVIAAAMSKAYAKLHEHWYRWLPLRDFPPLRPQDSRIAPYFFDWINRHAERDDYWDQLSLRHRYQRVQVPVLIYEGWYDVFAAGGIENYEGVRALAGTEHARQGSRLVIGPYAHNNWGRRVGDIDFGPAADSTYLDTTIAWFDYWLKGIGSGLADQPAVRYFTMGANTWQTAEQWPPPGIRVTSYFLAGETAANGLAGGGQLLTTPPGAAQRRDTYRYDPEDPVPSIGGNGCCYEPQSPMGPRDQRPAERRADVLVYSSAVLARDTEVTGTPVAHLYVSSSARCTDFTAKLVDVHPDGMAINVCAGIARVALEPSGSVGGQQVSQVTVAMSPTSIRFLAGHRIRVEISSSNFPLYDRNPNTGEPFGQSAAICIAQQTVFHAGRFSSRIELPVRTDDAHGARADSPT